MARIILLYANLTFATLLVVASILYIHKYRSQITWIKSLYMLVGSFWIVIYTLLALGYDTEIGLLIRPGLTLTLGVMATGALYRVLVGYRI